MLVGLVVGCVLGWLVGIIVNMLADDLPYRRRVGLPTYADGTPRPTSAWSGLLAFLLKQRLPVASQPNEQRKREYDAALRLGWRYPLTELLSMALMMLTVATAINRPEVTLLQLIFWMVYIAIFVLIVVIDIEHKLILFIVVIPSMGLALLNALITPETSVGTLQNALSGAAAGFIPFFILYLGGFVFTYVMAQARGEDINTVAFGYGDVMLMTLCGLILGFDRTIFGLFITVFLGAFGALGYMILRAFLGKRYSMFTAIPYGPYIVIAAIAMMLYGAEIRKLLINY